SFVWDTFSRVQNNGTKLLNEEVLHGLSKVKEANRPNIKRLRSKKNLFFHQLYALLEKKG
ncbi:21796_t:CDS:2, partial [Gigaspora rosea]